MPDTERRREIARRRTFAIISHPDAGKTTLTEKEVVREAARGTGRLLVRDSRQAPLVLFPDRWSLEHAVRDQRLRWTDTAA